MIRRAAGRLYGRTLGSGETRPRGQPSRARMEHNPRL